MPPWGAWGGYASALQTPPPWLAWQAGTHLLPQAVPLDATRGQGGSAVPEAKVVGVLTAAR